MRERNAASRARPSARVGGQRRWSAGALSASLASYVLRLAQPGGLRDPALVSGINVTAGKIVHPAVAAAVGV